MKTIIKSIAALALGAACILTAAAQTVKTENVDIHVGADFLSISADIVLDDLKLGSNKQMFITPVVKSTLDPDNSKLDSENSIILPSVLVNGRNMHISYERGVLRSFKEIKEHNVGQEVRRYNGTKQKVSYSERVPVRSWMRGRDTNVTFVFDSCGCTTVPRKI